MPDHVAAPDRTVAAGFITGAASVLASVLALIGVLVTGDDSGTFDDGTGLGAGNAPDRSCIAVVKAYQRSVQSDPGLVPLLTSEGTDGVSPVEADPEARRCGVSANALMQMR